MIEFLKLNGISIPVEANSFAEEVIPIGEVRTRSINGSAFIQENARKYKWSFSTPWMDRAIADRLTQFIEGKFLSWNFSLDLLSGTGVFPVLGTPTRFGTGGKFSSRINIPAGSSFFFNASNKLYRPNGWHPTQGYTMIVHSYRTSVADGVPIDGWYDYTIKGAVAFNRGVANPVGVKQYRNGVLGAWNCGNFTQMQSTLAGVTGHTTTGASAARDYSDLVFLPFELSDPGIPDIVGTTVIDWIPQLVPWRNGRQGSRAPIMIAESQWFAGGEVQVFGSILQVDQSLSGSEDILKSLKVELAQI